MSGGTVRWGQVRRGRYLAIAAPLAVVSLALALRIVGYGNMKGPYWDEITYRGDANAYIGREPPRPRALHPVPEIAESSWMHPPLGKWAIAAGMVVLGSNDLGGRAAAVSAGVAGVAITYLLGLELYGSIGLAVVGSLLLAVDGLHLVQSRIATLDVFLSTFLLAGVLFTCKTRRASPESPTFHGLVERNEVWAGIFFGAALAAKWSALPYLVLAAGATAAWTGPRRRHWSTLQRIAAVLAAFVVVPSVVYLVSYTSFFVQNGPDLGGFVHLQRAMLSYGLHFDNHSPYSSSPLTWPLLLHPIDYAHGQLLPGGLRIVNGKLRAVRVLAMGNPAVWWAFLAVSPVLVYRAVHRRQHSDLIVLAGYLAGWAPWLLSSRTRFLYYMLPSVPFMCLGLASAVWALRPNARKVAASAVVAIAGACALAYFPVWTGTPLPIHTYLQLAHLPGVRTRLVDSGN